MMLLQFLKKLLGTGGSRLGLSTDDEITVESLLYGLMMVSGNDAAVALCEFIAGDISSFAAMMNQKANDLGLTSTHFTSPHGLDQDDHYTTALELALITNYALKNETFRKIVNTQSCTITIDGNSKTLHNTNELLGYLDGVYGVKTGFTNGANRCLVTGCRRGNLDIICVVLGCDTKKDRGLDSIKLINYVFDNFSVINVREILNRDFSKWQTQNSSFFIINKGSIQNVELYLNENQIPYETIPVNNSCLDKVYTYINVPTSYNAPLNPNTAVGTIDLKINDTICFSVDILNKNLIKRKNIFHYLKTFIQNYFMYFEYC